MRIEATIPDATGEQLNQLTGELGVTRSQIVEEALALLVRAVLEARRGRRVAIVEAETQRTVCEIVSPILSQLEWAAHRAKLAATERFADADGPTRLIGVQRLRPPDCSQSNKPRAISRWLGAVGRFAKAVNTAATLSSSRLCPCR